MFVFIFWIAVDVLSFAFVNWIEGGDLTLLHFLNVVVHTVAIFAMAWIVVSGMLKKAEVLNDLYIKNKIKEIKNGK